MNAAKAEAKKKAAEEKAAGSEPTANPEAPVSQATGEPLRPASRSRAIRGRRLQFLTPAIDRASVPQRTRDAAEVKNSLLSYRAAVARGRSNGQGEEMPSPR